MHYSWDAQVLALRTVHGYGLASELGSLEAAQSELVAAGELEAAAVVAEWYAVVGQRQLELEQRQELERERCRCELCCRIHGRAA